MMKIHIIGGPGSGKSFLAEKLSKELGISHFDLDDLQWDNKSASYGIKRSPDERDKTGQSEHIKDGMDIIFYEKVMDI